MKQPAKPLILSMPPRSTSASKKPRLTRKIEDLNILILQRAAEEKTVVSFPVRGGILKEPIFLRFAELSSEPRSVEAILRTGLEETAGENFQPMAGLSEISIVEEGRSAATQSPAEPSRRFGLRAAPPELSEHLSLIARWFYSNPREGEIFFCETEWPYRRILRACARLLAQPPRTGDSAQSPSSQQKAMLSRERIKRLTAFSKPRRKPPQ